MSPIIFNPENCESLKKTCNKIISILNENVNGSLMASQLMALGEAIKEFSNETIVKTSGIISPKEIYLLLSDGDGTTRSKDEPFGVAVTSKEEAEQFAKGKSFGYSQSYSKIEIFDTTEKAINHYMKR